MELVLEEVSLEGVELDEDDDGLLDDGLALEPLVDESLLLELGGVALLELELLLGVLELGGVVALLELESLALLGLVPMELEPLLLDDGLDGLVLLPIEDELELDGDVASREAPVLEPGPLLQP